MKSAYAMIIPIVMMLLTTGVVTAIFSKPAEWEIKTPEGFLGRTQAEEEQEQAESLDERRKIVSFDKTEEKIKQKKQTNKNSLVQQELARLGGSYRDIYGNTWERVVDEDKNSRWVYRERKSRRKPKDKELTDKEFYRKYRIEMLGEKGVYTGTWTFFNRIVGKFAYDFVDRWCSNQWTSSEGEYDKPMFIDTVGSEGEVVAKGSVYAEQESRIKSCENIDQSIVAGQAYKSKSDKGYNYDISFSLTACREEISYKAYLLNTHQRFVTSGTLKKGYTTIHERKGISSEEEYGFLCIELSDRSLGKDGTACFPVVSS